MIENNTFAGDGKAIRIAADQGHGIRPMPSSGEWVTPAPTPHDHTIRKNQIQHSRVGIEVVGVKNSILDGNMLNHNDKDRIKKAKPGFNAK